MSIVYRSVKGSKLTSAEVDGNFQHLENLVGGTGNSIVTETGFTLVDQDVTFAADWVWNILNTQYTNPAAVVINIPFAATGNQRIDLIVANQSNTFERIAGTESVSNPTAPAVPLNKISVTFITVTDGEVGTPTDPIIGTSFVKKSFFAPFISTVTGADAIIPLDPNGYTEIRLTDASLTSIAGFDLSLITGVPTAEVPYNGKPYIIRNVTGNDITIKNELGAADYPFFLSGGADLVFPNGQAIYVLYDASGFNEIFKSWSTGTTDISGKQDKIIVVSASGTASNDQKYHVVSNATFTDPASPVEGKGYEVFVRNGIATIGGVAYPVGSYVFRTYHSAAWGSQLIGGGGSSANTQIFHWWGGNWSTTTLNLYYYIGYNGAAIETAPASVGTTISASMTGRNKGLFIAPFDCKIKRVLFKDGGSGSYTGKFALASGLPNYGGTWNIGYTNIVTHLDDAISSPGYAQNKFEFLVDDDITVPKGYVVSPMLIFSAQAGATKLSIEISIEIEEVV